MKTVIISQSIFTGDILRDLHQIYSQDIQCVGPCTTAGPRAANPHPAPTLCPFTLFFTLMFLQR